MRTAAWTAFAAVIESVVAVIDKDVFLDNQATVFEKPRTLVIKEKAIEEDDDKTDDDMFSEFFKGLVSRGHALTYASWSDEKVTLFEYDERLYDNIILFGGAQNFPVKEKLDEKLKYKSTEQLKKDARKVPAKKFLNAKTLLEFVDQGGNVLVGVSPAGVLKSDMKKFANECGINFLSKDVKLADHFNTVVKDGKEYVWGEGRKEFHFGAEKILFPAGVVHEIAPSELTFNVVSGSPTSYLYDESTSKMSMVKGPMESGEDVHLVSALQARNSARVVFMGSYEVCSNALWEENALFCKGIGEWTFHESGILRMSNLTSYKPGEEHIGQPYMYRVEDEIIFKIDIEEYKGGKWKPYVAHDVQLEFVMLDPYIRKFLSPPTETNSATYSTQFKAPDVYGVFKFKILYQRVGYNTLHVEHLAPLRNFKHNDYERFIWCASPYYASCLLTPVAVIFMSIRFLYHKESSEVRMLPSLF